MPIGRIVNTNERGFAFLRNDQPPFESTFVHYKELQTAGIIDPRIGMAFAYSIVPDPRSGKTRAVDCEYLESVAE